MVRVVWSRGAQADLGRLRQFLARYDPEAARRPVKGVRTGLRRLAGFPRIGRPAKDLPPEYREWFIPFGDGGYVVLYRVTTDEATILALRHAGEAGYEAPDFMRRLPRRAGRSG